MGVKYQRLKLQVQADNNYTRRGNDEFRTCNGNGCRNIIAAWAALQTGRVYCSVCNHTKGKL